VLKAIGNTAKNMTSWISKYSKSNCLFIHFFLYAFVYVNPRVL